jgi:hypothetical protein
MKHLSVNSSGKNNKSCSTFHQESNKIGFTFFWILYDFLWILQESAKHMYYLRFTFATRPLTILIPHDGTLGSCKTPWKESISCNVAPGGGGRRGQPEFRRAGGALGRGRCRGGVWAQQRSICGRSRGRGCAGVRARRYQVVATTASSPPARLRSGWDHTWRERLKWEIGKVLRALADDERARGPEPSGGGYGGAAERLGLEREKGGAEPYRRRARRGARLRG